MATLSLRGSGRGRDLETTKGKPDVGVGSGGTGLQKEEGEKSGGSRTASKVLATLLV